MLTRLARQGTPSKQMLGSRNCPEPEGLRGRVGESDGEAAGLKVPAGISALARGVLLGARIATDAPTSSSAPL